jgi:hypothetical protein
MDLRFLCPEVTTHAPSHFKRFIRNSYFTYTYTNMSEAHTHRNMPIWTEKNQSKRQAGVDTVIGCMVERLNRDGVRNIVEYTTIARDTEKKLQAEFDIECIEADGDPLHGKQDLIVIWNGIDSIDDGPMTEEISVALYMSELQYEIRYDGEKWIHQAHGWCS